MTDFTSYKVEGRGTEVETLESGGSIFKFNQRYNVIINGVGGVTCIWNGKTFKMVEPITRMDIPRTFDIDARTIMAVEEMDGYSPFDDEIKFHESIA